ncbi:uncharacterized protein J3D65DRAFT_700998 [Phyllosticta citribraziliensis]|uniref:F-box domain-containing protein n=1 Tax=Phyllosticta citribraziliensis TaxID=989973 RepID=A0ABR1LGA5_9PEZI
MRSSYHRLIDRVGSTYSTRRLVASLRRARRRRISTIEKLPLDLLWIIFEQLASQKMFLNLTKTSKALCWAVEPFVYDKISIGQRRRSDSDVHQISHAQSRLLFQQLRLHPQLGRRVQQLSVFVPPSQWRWDEPLLWYDFLRLLSKMPNIKRLEVRWQMLNILWLFRHCQGKKCSPESSPQLIAHPQGTFSHRFERLADLTLGPGIYEKGRLRLERLSDFVPILRLSALEKLTLHSFGMIWTCKEDFQMPALSSGIQSLKLVDTTLSGFSIISKQSDPQPRTLLGPGRLVVLEPAIGAFLGAIKKLKEFTWLYNPVQLSQRKFDFSTLLSDLECHAATLERLTIDAMSFYRHRVQHIGSMKKFPNLTSLTLPHGALIDERFFPLEHAFKNEETAIDVVPSRLPPKLQELVICPSEGYLEPAVRLAVFLEEKRRNESCFHAPESLWIGFRSKRYGKFRTTLSTVNAWTSNDCIDMLVDETFVDEEYLEGIAPMPYGDEDKFFFRSWNVTVALRGVSESFRSYIGHYMKMYHDHLRAELEDSEDSD